MTDPSTDSSATRVDAVIDLTADGSIGRAAQHVVDELHADFGTPWRITNTAGGVVAMAGPSITGGSLEVPFSAAGLSLHVDAEPAGHGDEPDLSSECAAAVARLGALLAEVIDAHENTAVADARATAAEQRAIRDQLTGLIDQGEWWRRIGALDEQLARHPRPTVVAVIDLDGLKVVNDTHGHLHGDLLIKLAARTLSGTVRSGDLVARVGGDEFAVLAADHGAPPDALEHRLTAALTDNGVAASVGIADYKDHPTLRAAFAAADRVMYDNKQLRHRRLHPTGDIDPPEPR